jgi:hypothetical protein
MSVASYFGRAWKLTVQPQAAAQLPGIDPVTGQAYLAPPPAETWTLGNSDWSESLRCTFDISQQSNGKWFEAVICVYNLLPNGPWMALKTGDLVTLEAGYQSPSSGVIFAGRLYERLWDIDGLTDYKLTLHSLTGWWESVHSRADVTIPAGSTDADAVRLVARQSLPSAFPVDYLDPSLSTSQKSIRSNTFGGKPMKFFADVAVNYGPDMQCFVGTKGLNIRPRFTVSEAPDVVYAPPYSIRPGIDKTSDAATVTRYTLLGTPQQLANGVTFVTLLDHEVQLLSIVKLTNVTPTQIRTQYLQPKPLVQTDGLFGVIEIRHVGDTRGNDWHTEMTALVRSNLRLYSHGAAV